MTDYTLQTILLIGFYLAFFTWTILTLLIGIQIFKRNYPGLKVSGLYLFNSLVFIIAWGLVLKLALIVRAPIAETKEKSIELLHNEAKSYFENFIFSSLLISFIMTTINVVYLKYVVKAKIYKHTLILLVATLVILLTASYLSIEWYYRGLLVEINRHF